MSVDGTIIADYQATRAAGVERSVLCHAPFTSLNFDQRGHARVCCYNWRASLGIWPESSLAEIWTGAEAMALRQSFIEGTEAKGCDLCFDQLRARNFKGALMQNFDQLSRVDGYRPQLQPHAPRVIELELSNTCNLECIQCQAKWSSLIRKNRDHLPPLPMPYDDAFVDQLEPFLPTLMQAKFLGGEPMLIRLYHLIWERIRAVNPDIVLSITTNGTAIPDRAWAALEHLRSHVCLSIDSLDPDNYARIRKNGSLETVLVNFERWRAYALARGTTVSLSVCPMTYNWRDLPEFLRFSQRYEAPLWFNTVVRPWAASLASLPHEELDEVAAYLSEYEPLAGEMNRAFWTGVIGQVRFWSHTRRALEARFPGLLAHVRGVARSHAALLARPDGGDDSAELVADALARLLAVSWLTNDTADRDLADRLVQMTFPGAAEDAVPAERTTLLRVLVLVRNLGLLGTATRREPGPIDEAQLRTEIELVNRFIGSRMTRADWNALWDVFPGWGAIAEWLDRLLERARTEAS